MTSLLRHLLFVVLLLSIPVAVVPAEAQTIPTERVFLSGNGGFRPTSDTFGDSITFDLFKETGDFEVDYHVDSGPAVDGGAIVRLWKGIGVGVGLSFFDSTDTADLTARIPHPFFFDQHRQTSGVAPELKRQETAVHLHGVYLLGFSDWARVAVFAGPTFFTVDQDLVQTIRHIETAYPFDSVAFDGHRSVRASESTVGFNAGVDGSFFVLRKMGLQQFEALDHIGFGFLLRFTRATVDVSAGRGDRTTLDLGGVQVTVGVRLRF